MGASQEKKKKKKKKWKRSKEKNVRKKFPLVLIKIQQYSNTPHSFPLPLSFSLSSVCSNSHRLALLPPCMPPRTVHDHPDEFIKLAAFLIEMEQ